MSETSTNPFDGMYIPDEEDGPVPPPPVAMPPMQGVPVAPAVAPPTPQVALPVAPPVQVAFSDSGMPVAPPTVGLPVAPAAHGSVPVAPVATVAQAALPVMPVAPPAPSPVVAPPIPPYQPSHQGPIVVAPPMPQPVAPQPVAPQPVAPQPVTAAPVAEPRRNPDGPVMPTAASAPGVSQVDSDDTDDDEHITLDDLLVAMVEAGGSDLHLSAGSAPRIRVRGDLAPMKNDNGEVHNPLSARALMAAMYSVMTNKQKAVFEEKKELDFAYTVPGQARFRVNVLQQQGTVAAVMRAIPWEILSLDALRLPEVIGAFSDLPRGLVLVTGPTGSGKSTTLAAIVDKANRTRAGHIITIEDPVEFLHESRKSLVNQREVGEDTHSFANALKHVLRQDPDIILVGELRDLETISVALTAAETGHLVFATLHTQSAAETITRIVDVFPSESQAQVRTQLAASLQGVVCQTLCKTADGNGRQAAVEIMIADSNIRSLIRTDKLQQIQSALQTGGKLGMQTLNQDLAKHVLDGRITYDAGLEKASDKEDFDVLVGGREKGEAVLKRIAAQSADQPQGMYGYAPPPSV